MCLPLSAWSPLTSALVPRRRPGAGLRRPWRGPGRPGRELRGLAHHGADAALCEVSPRPPEISESWRSVKEGSLKEPTRSDWPGGGGNDATMGCRLGHPGPQRGGGGTRAGDRDSPGPRVQHRLRPESRSGGFCSGACCGVLTAHAAGLFVRREPQRDLLFQRTWESPLSQRTWEPPLPQRTWEPPGWVEEHMPCSQPPPGGSTEPAMDAGFCPGSQPQPQALSPACLGNIR